MVDEPCTLCNAKSRIKQEKCDIIDYCFKYILYKIHTKTNVEVDFCNKDYYKESVV